MSKWTHLLVEAIDCDYSALSDSRRISDFLNKLPPKIGMKKLGPPVIYNVTEDIHDDIGVTGVVVITTSHISIHTFPNGQPAQNILNPFLVFDCFSCKDFDAEMVKAEIKRIFKPRIVKSKRILRALNEPDTSPI